MLKLLLLLFIPKQNPTLFQPYRLLPTRLLHPWDFPGKNTSVGCHFLLQGIFLTQGMNLPLMRWLEKAMDNPLQYSCLENPMDGGAWQAAVHGVLKSWTQLSNFTFTFIFMHWRRKWQPTPVFLPGESQRRGSLVGCRLWGRTESDTTEATSQQQQQLLRWQVNSLPLGHQGSQHTQAADI